MNYFSIFGQIYAILVNQIQGVVMGTSDLYPSQREVWVTWERTTHDRHLKWEADS